MKKHNVKNVKNVKSAGEVLAQESKSLVIAQPKVQTVCLEVEGTAALVQNAFNQKIIEEMLRKHMGISVQREKKNPRQVLKNAEVRNIDGHIALPPTAFKKAMLTACGQIKGLRKGLLRTQLFVVGQSIPITYKSQVPRMDVVRTSGMTRTPDIRFRPAFEGWKARMAIQFGDVVSVQAVVDLLNRAGSVGVGEWRPEKDGTFGTFRVSRHISARAEIDEVHEICAVPLVSAKIPDWALDADIDPEVLAKMFDEEQAAAKPDDDEQEEDETGT